VDRRNSEIRESVGLWVRLMDSISLGCRILPSR
jgi:hypothetical protein